MGLVGETFEDGNEITGVRLVDKVSSSSLFGSAIYGVAIHIWMDLPPHFPHL